MFKRARNWRKLIKFILKCRKQGKASFQLLSTSDELIIYPSRDRENNENLRIKY